MPPNGLAAAYTIEPRPDGLELTNSRASGAGARVAAEFTATHFRRKRLLKREQRIYKTKEPGRCTPVIAKELQLGRVAGRCRNRGNAGGTPALPGLRDFGGELD